MTPLFKFANFFMRSFFDTLYWPMEKNQRLYAVILVIICTSVGILSASSLWFQ